MIASQMIVPHKPQLTNREKFELIKKQLVKDEQIVTLLTKEITALVNKHKAIQTSSKAMEATFEKVKNIDQGTNIKKMFEECKIRQNQLNNFDL